jgi:hypothetical protein
VYLPVLQVLDNKFNLCSPILTSLKLHGLNLSIFYTAEFLVARFHRGPRRPNNDVRPLIGGNGDGSACPDIELHMITCAEVDRVDRAGEGDGITAFGFCGRVVGVNDLVKVVLHYKEKKERKKNR